MRGMTGLLVVLLLTAGCADGGNTAEQGMPTGAETVAQAPEAAPSTDLSTGVPTAPVADARTYVSGTPPLFDGGESGLQPPLTAVRLTDDDNLGVSVRDEP